MTAYNNAYQQWDSAELSRQGRLRIAKSDQSKLDAEIKGFASVFNKIKDETENNRDDKITAFPASLESDIKSFTDGVNSVLKDKTA